MTLICPFWFLVAKKGRGNQIWEHPLKYMVFGTCIIYKPDFTKWWWTLPNFIKIKHPRKGEKKKQGARTNDQASKQLKRDGPRGKGTTENQTLHQSCEAYQLKRLKRGGGKPHITPSLEEPSLAKQPISRWRRPNWLTRTNNNILFFHRSHKGVNHVPQSIAWDDLFSSP
jgi:hypothetical protein